MIPSAFGPPRRLTVGLCLSLTTGCCCPATFKTSTLGVTTGSPVSIVSTPLPPQLLEASDSITQTEFHSVDFEVAAGIVLGIQYLRGVMTSTGHGAPIVFDDKTSFSIGIDTAEVGLSTEVLNHLMNEYVFAYRGAPLRNLTFSIVGTQLRQSGILHKGVDIPFELTATLSATSNGLIRVHPTALKICSLNGAGLMRALGLQLANFLDLSKAKGASVQGNDLLLDPNHLLPPPTIHGRLVAVRVSNGQLVQSFGHDPSASSGTALAALTPPDAEAANYMYFRGGTLRFGKLAMVRADLQLVDLNPSTPFAFNLDHYQGQLAAGYSKTGLDLSLQVFIPDYAGPSASNR